MNIILLHDFDQLSNTNTNKLLNEQKIIAKQNWSKILVYEICFKLSSRALLGYHLIFCLEHMTAINYIKKKTKTNNKIGH